MAGKIGQWMTRLTGISTPLFGVSWQAPPAERGIATQLFARLEDRRVLYNPSDAEVPHHCVQSIIEIRRILTDALASLDSKSILAEHIRAMGSASRRFLDRIGTDYDAMRSNGHYLSWEFLDALGQMRALFGVHLAMIAARYDLQVRGGLREILPPESLSDDLDTQAGSGRSHRDF